MTSMKRVTQIVFHNWWLKLLSLAMAWFLWSFVTQGSPGGFSLKGPPVETGMLAGLGVRNLPADLRVEGELPTPVYIQLSGPERLVEGLRSEEVIVMIDLTGATAGESVIVLESKHARVPPGVAVVGFVPDRVRLNLVMKQGSPAKE